MFHSKATHTDFMLIIHLKWVKNPLQTNSIDLSFQNHDSSNIVIALYDEGLQFKHVNFMLSIHLTMAH